MKQRIFFLIVVVILNAGIIFAKRPAPEAVIPLEPHPGGTFMMTISASVGGHTGRFIFDTGGGVTYISPTFANTVGCEPWGQLTGFMLTGQRLDMPRCDGLEFDTAGRSLAVPIAGVFDIGKYMPPESPRIDGSIGLDAFAGKAVTLALKDRSLIIESAKSLAARIKTGREISIRLVREAEGTSLSVVAAVPTSKGTAWMELDSGNGGANVIGKHIAGLYGLDIAKKEPQEADITVGGVPVKGLWRVNDTLTMDGNIGTRFMIDWELTFDLASGRAWLNPAK